MSRFPASSTIRILLACGLLSAIAGCVNDGLSSVRPNVDIGARTAAISPPVSMGAVRTAGFSPGMVTPGMPDEPQQAVMPDSEIECRKRLRRLDVTFTDSPPINEGGGCQVAWPVVVTGLSSGVKMEPAATLTCAMAEAVATWNKKELVPAARTRYFSGVDTIKNGSSYSCRRIRGTGTLSAHGTGNALDIMDITLKSGKSIDVRKPGFFAFREKSLLKNVRHDACPYFNTVLGPGFNYDHRDHFHFDLMSRRSGHKVCK